MSATQEAPRETDFASRMVELFTLLKQKGVTLWQLKRLLDSGVLADLLSVAPEKLDRNDIALTAGVFPFGELFGRCIRLQVDREIAQVWRVSDFQQKNKCQIERRVAAFPVYGVKPNSAWEYQILTPSREMPLEWATKFIMRAGWRHCDFYELLAVVECLIDHQIGVAREGRIKIPITAPLIAAWGSIGDEVPVAYGVTWPASKLNVYGQAMPKVNEHRLLLICRPVSLGN
jgi:hypothetical protein